LPDISQLVSMGTAMKSSVSWCLVCYHHVSAVHNKEIPFRFFVTSRIAWAEGEYNSVVDHLLACAMPWAQSPAPQNKIKHCTDRPILVETMNQDSLIILNGT
jgi:hypothetical protein